MKKYFVLVAAFIFSCTSNIESPDSVLEKYLASNGISSSSNGGGDDDSSSSGVEVSSSSSTEISSSSVASSSSATGGDSSSGGSDLGEAVIACGGKNYDSAKYFCDTRDEKAYKLVNINGQIWMAENLNYNASGSKCGSATSALVDANTYFCNTYGRLYNWATAMANSGSSTENPSGVRGVCPSGWHLPSKAEWDKLISYVGGSSIAGKRLKASDGWTDCGHSSSDKQYFCNDTYGFAALPGGNGHSDGKFDIDNVGNYGNWWSASIGDVAKAYRLCISYNGENASMDLNDTGSLFSVRCLQD